MSTQYIGTKYQLAAEDDINAKLTALTKQVEALAFAKATTVVPKETPIIYALCDTMDHNTDVCSIVAKEKKTHGQVNAINQVLRLLQYI